MTFKETPRFSFQETDVLGVFIITLKPIKDDRGFFARSFCKKEMAEMGLKDEFVQCNIAQTHKKGTLRGLHYQRDPHEEVKIVFCQRGAIYDVVVDNRKTSETYGKWVGVELSAKNYQALYIPEGCANGYQSLCDDVEIFYLMSNYHHPAAAAGIRWDDPTLAITWPHEACYLSEFDKKLPEFIP